MFAVTRRDEIGADGMGAGDGAGKVIDACNGDKLKGGKKFASVCSKRVPSIDYYRKKGRKNE